MNAVVCKYNDLSFNSHILFCIGILNILLWKWIYVVVYGNVKYSKNSSVRYVSYVYKEDDPTNNFCRISYTTFYLTDIKNL